MEQTNVSLEHELRRLRRITYVGVGFSLITALLCASATFFAIRALGDYVTLTKEAHDTILAAQQTTAHANATLAETEIVLQNARATMGKTQQAIQEATATTQQAQSAIQNTPNTILRSIPVLNWFVGQ